MIGTTFWITGLSGAGKTTIGTLLYKHIMSRKNNIVFLDGDVLREVYQDDDYSMEGRKRLAFRNGRLCKMLNSQGIDVVICVIAMYDDCREWNRCNIPLYREIYLKVGMDELIRRDQKGLYSRALNNEITNVMGVDVDYEEPKAPDLVVDNSGVYSPDRVLQIIIDALGI